MAYMYIHVHVLCIMHIHCIYMYGQCTCRLVLKKEDLDDAFKDKKFPETSKVEILFENDREMGQGIHVHVHVYTCIYIYICGNTCTLVRTLRMCPPNSFNLHMHAYALYRSINCTLYIVHCISCIVHCR